MSVPITSRHVPAHYEAMLICDSSQAHAGTTHGAKLLRTSRDWSLSPVTKRMFKAILRTSCHIYSSVQKGPSIAYPQKTFAGRVRTDRVRTDRLKPYPL